MDIAELPGAGLGAQFGLHVYPLHTRIITIGLGGELAIGHASHDPSAGTSRQPAPPRFARRKST